MAILNHVDDPRRLLDKFKRKHLEFIFKQEGIHYEPGQAATISREILASKGIDGSRYAGMLRPDPLNGFNGRQEVNVPKVEKSVDEMKMHELRTICKEKGIKISVSDKKDDLIERLKKVPTFS